MRETDELTYAEVSGKHKRPQTVILVSGYKRAGKDYISGILKELLLGSTTYSFAGPLKDIVATTLGCSLQELEDFKNNGDTLYEGNDRLEVGFRKILQVFGTEAMKKWFGDNVWVDLFVDLNLPNDYIIISDWRFTVEFEEVSKVYQDVITLRVNDDNIVNTDMHASETELDGFEFDYVIDNTAKNASVMDAVFKFIKEVEC